MNYLIDFVIAYPGWCVYLIALTSALWLKIKNDNLKKFFRYSTYFIVILGCVIAFNSALVKPKTHIEPFKPSEVVTHQMDEETASKPFTDRLSKPKESKLNDSLTFKQEVQKYNN